VLAPKGLGKAVGARLKPALAAVLETPIAMDLEPALGGLVSKRAMMDRWNYSLKRRSAGVFQGGGFRMAQVVILGELWLQLQLWAICL
jgi:hypothetical protein